MKLKFHLGASLVVVALAGSSAHATIINGSVTGGAAQDAGGVFEKLTPPLNNPFGSPNSVGDDTFQSPNLFGFDEGQNIFVPGALSVDDLADGLGGGLGPGSLPQGTLVASHYVFFDPESGQSQTGFVEFDSDILAVISSTDNLADSDFLINTGINYLNPGFRGLEGGDDVTINGLRRIEVDWTASTPGDYVRVLTEFSPGAVIPEPASIAAWLLLGVVGFVYAWRRRRAP